jgi:hypothetical protein
MKRIHLYPLGALVAALVAVAFWLGPPSTFNSREPTSRLQRAVWFSPAFGPKLVSFQVYDDCWAFLQWRETENVPWGVIWDKDGLRVQAEATPFP